MVRGAITLLLAALALVPAGQCLAGKYVLAYWRETGFNEKGGIGGNHVINVHVWDENGNPLSGKHIYATALDMGATDANGQVELAIYEPNSYPLRVVDGSHTSDTSPGFSSTRAPDWGHYCFECGFVYVSDTGNLPSFDVTYNGILNSSSANYVCNNPEMSAPTTRSLCFYSTDPRPGYYCSDGTEGGSAVASVGQTFRASGNRVVAAKFHALGGNAQYTLKIREGGPTGAYVGTAATSPYVGTYEYGKTLTKWGLNAIPVVAGNTYFLEITKPGGGTFNVNRVANDNYPYGSYYEGTTPLSMRELRGHVVCATVGSSPTTGTLSGYVRDTGSNPISGASVTTNTGGYFATSDGAGFYTILGVLPGSYNLTASRTGYNSQINSISVTAGQTTTSNFTLAPTTGAITGYVRDGSASPISGATVATTTGGYTTATASNGSYTLANVLPATYSVTASKSGYGSQTNSGVTVTAGQTISSDFTLSCLAATITAEPQSITRTVGQSAIFGVTATGAPPISYQWKKNGVNIPAATASTYTIHSVASGDAGSYTCVATNPCGTDASAAATLTVNTGVSTQWDADKVWTAASNPTKVSDTPWFLEGGANDTELWGTCYKLGTNVYDRNRQRLALVCDSNGNTTSSGKNKFRSDNEGWVVDNTKTTALKLGIFMLDSGGPYPAMYIRTSSYGVQIVYDEVQQAWLPGSGATLNGASPTRLAVPLQTWHYIRLQMEPNGAWQAWLNDDPGQRMWGTVSGGGGGPYVQFGTLGDRSDNIEFALDFVAWGQGASIGSFGTGVISGSVKDASNNPIAQATVATTSGGYTTTTNSSGTYALAAVASGTYDVVASKAGYTSQTQAGKVVSMGLTTTASFVLSPAALPVASIREAKDHADGTRVMITGRTVSAKFGDCFYLQDDQRVAGIKVTGASATEGALVTVTGVLATANGERVLTQAEVQ